jgi:hypothetical protein
MHVALFYSYYLFLFAYISYSNHVVHSNFMESNTSRQPVQQSGDIKRPRLRKYMHIFQLTHRNFSRINGDSSSENEV